MVSKLLIVLAVAVAGVAVVGGVYAFMGDDDSKREGTVEDSVGNKIDISKEYKRISSMTAVGTEIVSDLGLRSSLVAVTNSAHIYEMTEHVYGLNMTFDYPATIPDDIASGKLVGFKWGVKAENVAATNPDLVIMDPASVNKDDSTMKQLQALGIACFVLFEENDWDTIGKNYLSLGKILNKEKRAQEINKACVDADKTVIDKFKGQKSLKVAYVCYCYDTYYIYNQSGAMDAALRLGCTNAMPTNTTTTITPEQIAAADPDIILFDDMGTSLNWTDVIAKWKADSVMGSIRAIANNDFYCMEAAPFQATSYPSVHYIMGEGLVATMLYPEIVGVEIPNIVTAEDYVEYLEWMDA